jgi:large subunit ribosomal protein L10
MKRYSDEKKDIVLELTEKLRSVSGVFIDYSGTTVADDTEMRRAMRAANVDYAVVKNTLTRFAAANVGFEALDEHLNGTTALAVSAEDPVAPAKILNEYAKKPNSKIKIKAGFLNGKLITPPRSKLSPTCRRGSPGRSGARHNDGAD